ncbi:MAG: hypothetical protein AAF518_05055 [Spirochaetota bacterium]
MTRLSFLFVSIFSFIPLFPAELPPFDGFVRQESYLFPGKQVRHSMLRFPALGIEISKHCLYKNAGRYTARNCKAWKIYHLVLEKKPQEILNYVEKQYIKTFREYNLLLCKKVSGVIQTETNEYNPFSGRVELQDFCAFSDGSLVGIRSLRTFIMRSNR